MEEYAKLERVGIFSVLTSPHASQESGELVLYGDRRTASVFYVDGQVVHAECAGQSGLDVLSHLYSWDKARYLFRGGVKSRAETIRLNGEQLLGFLRRLEKEKAQTYPARTKKPLSGKHGQSPLTPSGSTAGPRRALARIETKKSPGNLAKRPVSKPRSSPRSPPQKPMSLDYVQAAMELPVAPKSFDEDLVLTEQIKKPVSTPSAPKLVAANQETIQKPSTGAEDSSPHLREVPKPTEEKKPHQEPSSAAPKVTQEVKEETSSMNINLLRETFAEFKENASEGLLASDIWAMSTGQAIIGYNSQPVATALFNRMSGYVNKSLADSGFPGVNKYYMIDLADNKAAVVVYISEEYLWGMLVDTTAMQIGLLLHVIVPQAREKFQKAIKS